MTGRGSLARSLTVGMVCALALGGLLAARVLLSRKGPVSDDPALPGRWISPAVALELTPSGRYWMANVTSGGGLSISECGRWRALEGSLQMRALMGPTALRAGRYQIGPDGNAQLELQAAHAPTLHWTLAREENPLPLSAGESQAIPAECRGSARSPH